MYLSRSQTISCEKLSGLHQETQNIERKGVAELLQNELLLNTSLTLLSF